MIQAHQEENDSVSGFKHVSSYAQDKAMPDEFGATDDIRWLLTTNATRTNATTGYQSLIFGQEFYGTTKIEGSSSGSNLIAKSAAQVGGALERFGTLGWLKNFAAQILNDNFGHVLITTV